MWNEFKSRFIEWRCHVYEKRTKRNNKKYIKYVEKCTEREQYFLELETEEGKEKAWQEKYIKSKAYMAIIFGLTLLMGVLVLSYYCEVHISEAKWKALCSAVISCLNSVFSIIIGIGISTLVLDFFSYIKYTRNRIKEIMLDKKYIETLSDKEKRKMIESTEKSLYFKNGEIADNSLYANIKELIVPLIESNYYKQYKVHVDSWVDEEKGIIVKKVHKIMDVMCINNHNEFRLPFSTYLSHIDGIDDDELYKISECIFSGKNVTVDVADRITHSSVDGDEYIEDVKFTVNYVFTLKKGLNRIEIRTQTIVPISDNTYAHTITIPCRRYSINYSIHTPEYEVIGFAFAFDDEGHKDDIDRIIYRDKYDDCYKIRFEDWTLPGDGVVFVVNKKR